MQSRIKDGSLSWMGVRAQGIAWSRNLTDICGMNNQRDTQSTGGPYMGAWYRTSPLLTHVPVWTSHSPFSVSLFPHA